MRECEDQRQHGNLCRIHDFGRQRAHLHFPDQPTLQHLLSIQKVKSRFGGFEFWRANCTFVKSGDWQREKEVTNRVEIGGESDFLKSVNVAQLCLKHRINKHQKQRIVVFVASVVNVSDEELERLAQKLKRNSIAVNLVNLCEEANKEKLSKVHQ